MNKPNPCNHLSTCTFEESKVVAFGIQRQPPLLIGSSELLCSYGGLREWRFLEWHDLGINCSIEFQLLIST